MKYSPSHLSGITRAPYAYWRRLFGLIVLAIGIAGIALRAQNNRAATSEPELLEYRKSVERRLAGGQSHKYRFTLNAGEYARVIVEQRTIHVAVDVWGPDHKQLFSGDTYDIGTQQPAEFIADESGIHELRISASDLTAPTGTYELALRDLAVATDRDRNRAAAARAVALAASLSASRAREGMLQGISHLEEALSHWRTAGDRFEEARAIHAIALLYIELGDRAKALDYANQSLSAAKAAGDDSSVARALDLIGEVHNYFDDKGAAIEYYERALLLLRATHDRAGEGRTLSNLGVAYSGTGEKRKALVEFNKAVGIFRDLQDRRMLAEVAGNIGMTYDHLGEYQSALENHEYELGLQRALGDRASEAITLNNIGSAYSGLGAYQKALDAYTAAADINRSLDNRWNLAINLNNIAWVYANLGDNPRALRFYQEALEDIRPIGDQRRLAATLNNIANVYLDLGDYRKAISVHSEALPLRRAVGDVDGEANSLNNLGNAYAKLGDRQKAREYFERALAIHRSSGNRYMLARTLRNLGSLSREAQDYERAELYLKEALDLSHGIRDRSGEAAALADLARLECDRGKLPRARERAEEALAALESVRLSVVSPNLRASLFASVRNIQELSIEVLMRLHADQPDRGFDAAALFVSESSRARSLLELLTESGAEIRRDVDSALLDRERELTRRIAAKAAQQMRVVSGKHTDIEAASVEKELDALTSDLEQVQSRIRETSPRYAALTQPSALTVQELQSRVLDEDTVLLEYALGKDKSFLWAVTPSSINSFQLPPRAEIEAAGKYLYEILTARNQTPAGETPEARAARLRKADQAAFAAATKASRILLGPVAALIHNKRLLIAGDGILQYLPFASLPEPPTDGASRASKSPPLIVNHEIVSAPSASVIAVLRQELAGRRPAKKVLMLLADPVFSADDARVAKTSKAFSDAIRSDYDVDTQRFLRLRFSRREAEAIARLAPPGLTLKVLDFEANRDTILSADLSQYRIVHFATHSVLNNQRPELSGVVLSLFDQAGRPQNGFLRLYDIYNLRLGADLVVLSACQTALGREIKGEGLIGLTRAFLYAGAPRVAATLWEIDDRTTAELMKRFYESMLLHGNRPAAALRDAQIALWRTRGWEAPYYWAAFTLQGEWR